MSMKKIACVLSAGALFAAAAPVLADHRMVPEHPTVQVPDHVIYHGWLTPSELEIIANFQSEANYRRYVRELAFKYGVSVGAVERMARIQLSHLHDAWSDGYRIDRYR